MASGVVVHAHANRLARLHDSFRNSALLCTQFDFAILAAQGFEERRRVGESAVLRVGVRVVIVLIVAMIMTVVLFAVAVVFQVAMAARSAAVVRDIEG